MMLEVGAEAAVFQQLQQLISQHKLQQLIDLCEQQIAKTPDWLTPYLFAGAAYADLGQLDRSIERLDFVVKHSGGDPQYRAAQEIIARLKSSRGN
jgi:hypothetical protein